MRRIDVTDPALRTAEARPSEPIVVLTIAVFALMPILRGSTLWAAPGAATDPLRSVSLNLYDLPLLAVVVMSSHALLTKVGVGVPRSPISVLAATSAGWALVTLAVHPSWRGVDWVAHVFAAAAVAWVLARAEGSQGRTLVATFVVLAVAQGAFGVMQSLNRSTFGITLIEYRQELVTFGSQVAGKGSLGHPYHLTTVLLVGVAAIYYLAERCDRRRVPVLLLGIAALGFALPFTYSRAMILAVAVIVPVAALAPSRALRPVTAALVAGMAAAFLLTSPGWSAKAEASLGDRADSGRVELAGEALDLLADEPVFGVGPGRYVIERSDQAGVVSNPPHNAFLHAGAEMGLPGMLIVVAALVGSGWWAIRSGPLAVIVWVAPMPMVLLDHFPYTSPRGIVISGFWIGLFVRVISQRD